MRLRHATSMLAAVLANGAMTAAPARAKFDNVTFPTYYAGATPPVAHSSGDSTEWAAIAIGAAGGVVLLGAGVTTARRRVRRSTSASQVRAASGP